MGHICIDGTVVVAQLKRGLLGGAVYKDVSVREENGRVRRIGTIMALTDLRHAMVPGSRGRFYFYDVLGAKGVYGFRPAGGRAHAHFPYRWDLMSTGIGALNLLLALGLWLLEGKLPFLSTTFGVMGLIIGVLFFATRLGAMRAWRADAPRVPGPAELRAARARA